MLQPTWNEIALAASRSGRSASSSWWAAAGCAPTAFDAALECGSGTGKDRAAISLSAGPPQSTRRSLASLVDELETTEVEMTHD